MLKFLQKLNPFSPKAEFDAAKTTKKRPAPRVAVRSEDREATSTDKAKLTNAARDVAQNFAAARFAISKHLDFIAAHNFNCQDPRLTALMAEWSENCDVSKRHSLGRFIRLTEARAVVDGDVFLVKKASGQLQAIESDRVKDPPVDKADEDLKNWVHGIKVDPFTGESKKLAIWGRRDRQTLEHEHNLDFNKVLQHGYFDRFDQVRGFSPLASAINTFKDVYESFDYALAKAKVAQFFGMVIYRESAEAIDPDDDYPSETDDTTGNPQDKGYDLDIGKGHFLLDLEPGDKADFLSNDTPGTDFDAFAHHLLAIALKSLDLPYSFFDGSKTNFFGAKAELTLYTKSAQEKRKNIQRILNCITDWKINQWKSEGKLPIGKKFEYEWTAHGLPWWGPQDVKTDIEAINNNIGLQSEIYKERSGRDWFKDFGPGGIKEREAEILKAYQPKPEETKAI